MLDARGTQPDSNESSFSVRLRSHRQIGGPWWFSCWPVLCPKVILHPRKVNIYRATAISYIYVLIKAIRHRHSLVTKPWTSNLVQVAENSNVSTPVIELKDAGGLSPPGDVVENTYNIIKNSRKSIRRPTIPNIFKLIFPGYRFPQTFLHHPRLLRTCHPW